jgi:hypothetical protein
MTPQAEKAGTSHPEARKGVFAVDMRYNSDFLFYYLTHDSHRQTISLDNNLEAITEPGYDIFRVATIRFTSDLKVKSQSDWPDRSTKTLSVYAGLWNKWQSEFFQPDKIPALMEALYAQGIDTDLTRFSEPLYIHNRFLVAKNENPPWGLITDTLKTEGVQIVIPYPKQLIDLNSSVDIQKALTPITRIMEKVMRACYQMEKKHLPMEKLVFTPKPVGEETKKYFASCTYCNADYSIVNGPTCPHCGASKPTFGTTHT